MFFPYYFVILLWLISVNKVCCLRKEGRIFNVIVAPHIGTSVFFHTDRIAIRLDLLPIVKLVVAISLLLSVS